MGSNKVIDLPLNLVAPETVRKMKTKANTAVAKAMAILESALNCSSWRFLRTYSTMTKTFMIQKTQWEARCSLDLMAAKETKGMSMAMTVPST